MSDSSIQELVMSLCEKKEGKFNKKALTKRCSMISVGMGHYFLHLLHAKISEIK